MPRSIDYTNKVITPKGQRPLGAVLSRDSEATLDLVALKLKTVAKMVDDLIRDKGNDYIDFFNIPLTADRTRVVLDHGFNGAVRWYVVDQTNNTQYSYLSIARSATAATDPTNQLALDCELVDGGNISVRVERIQ